MTSSARRLSEPMTATSLPHAFTRERGERALDRGLHLGQVRGDGFALERLHHQRLARSVGAPVEQRQDGTGEAAEERLDVGRHRAFTLDGRLVEELRRRGGAAQDGRVEPEDLGAEHRAMLLGAAGDEAEHVADEGEGLANEGETGGSGREGRGHVEWRIRGKHAVGSAWQNAPWP